MSCIEVILGVGAGSRSAVKLVGQLKEKSSSFSLGFSNRCHAVQGVDENCQTTDCSNDVRKGIAVSITKPHSPPCCDCGSVLIDSDRPALRTLRGQGNTYTPNGNLIPD